MPPFDLSRRLAAEALGTALLVATVVGSGIMAETLTKDVALALLGNTLPTGAILVVLITILGPISGAHFNPAVSIAEASQGGLPAGDLAAYVPAQLAGAYVGVAVADAMFGEPVFAWSTHVRAGLPLALSETIATFGLLAIVLGGARRRPDAVPFAAGAYITAAYWFTASTSFANPAVTLARSLTQTFAGIRPADAPGFIAAQIAGMALGLVVARLLAPDDASTAPRS